MTEQLELKIEFGRDWEDCEDATKELPATKMSKITQIVIPVLLVIFLTALFLIQLLLLETVLWEAILFSYGIPAVIYFGLTILANFLIKRAIKKVELGSIKINRNRKWILNSEGINIDAAISESVLSWNYISKVKEIEGLFIFQMTKKSGLFFPKRILDANQHEIFQQILEQNLEDSKIEFLPETNVTNNTEVDTQDSGEE